MAYVVMKISLFEILGFTCKYDEDCNQGYCDNGTCVCLYDFAYKQDCSISGCEYDTFYEPTFENLKEHWQQES